MNVEFLVNNIHLQSLKSFQRIDPHLSQLSKQIYQFHSPIMDELPMDIPGIYNVVGGRQVGKTTLLKQWMLHVLNSGVLPQAIFFLSCELIVDELSLYRIVMDQLEEMPKNSMRYLIIDEITYVRNWDRAIKYLADTGAFEKTMVVISGSDLVMMQEARKRFPGRRGKADKVDFHYYPLTFRQCFELKHHRKKSFFSKDKPTKADMDLVFEEFNLYLIHGGFLTAINEYAEKNSISNRTLATYSDWIRGDVIKRGKNEHYLREIIAAIIKHYSSQISWRNLVNALSIDHVQTAIDYITLLESMDAVFVQAALIEDKLVAAPKKHRKFVFCDPFIFHANRSWLKSVEDPFQQQIIPAITDAKLVSLLVEAIVTTHFRQYYPTYYLKANNEVDIAYVKDDKFWPIEVKWTNQIRPQDLKQISKYKNGKVWGKIHHKTEVNNLPILSLPWELLNQWV